MAQQLAAQEYLTRLQSAARDPTAYAALAAQGILPNYEMLSQGSKSRSKNASSAKSNAASLNIPQTSTSISSSSASGSMLDQLRLPSDTEIIKYTSDASSSGRSKASSSSFMANSKKRKKSDASDQPSSTLNFNPPVIPPGN